MTTTVPNTTQPSAKKALTSPFPEVPRGNVMELRLRNFRQLYNSLDPSPFIEKDLDQDAEEFLISWAREIPRGQPLGLIVHLMESDPQVDESEVVTSAIRHYFEYRFDLKKRDLHEFFRQANTSLVIGLIVLTACTIVGLRIETAAGEQPWGILLRESLLIGGWVAMWKPLELFLYDWWPIRRTVRLFRRLATMPIQVETPKT